MFCFVVFNKADWDFCPIHEISFGSKCNSIPAVLCKYGSLLIYIGTERHSCILKLK